jgi:CheY-like chemotaxis protein
MDGLEAARRARVLSAPGMRVLPILAMTAHALESDRKQSLQAGMQEHLTKPIDPKQMYASLAKWVRFGKLSVAGSGHSGAAAPDRLGDMPGLSVHNALQNLGGNESLYRNLLSRVVESYEHVPHQVSGALAAGDQQLAVRLAHTVKGVAANLGAFSLASVAGDLENTLAAGKQHDVLLAQMRDVLRQTVESMRCLIAAVLPEPDTAAVRQEMSLGRQAEVVALLRAAPERISSDWMSLQQQMTELKSLLGHSATASAYAALIQAIDDFDADAAQTQADNIIALLQGRQV